MDELLSCIYSIAMIHLIFQIPLGIGQVLHALYIRNKKGQTPEFYKNLEQYLIVVVMYFFIWLLGSKLPIPWLDAIGKVILLSYFWVLPNCLALYYLKICMKNNQEIEHGIEPMGE